MIHGTKKKKTTLGSTALSNAAVWDPQIRSTVSLLCTHYCCSAARSKWGRERRILAVLFNCFVFYLPLFICLLSFSFHVSLFFLSLFLSSFLHLIFLPFLIQSFSCVLVFLHSKSSLPCSQTRVTKPYLQPFSYHSSLSQFTSLRSFSMLSLHRHKDSLCDLVISDIAIKYFTYFYSPQVC